ncbi:MAG: hypothetical protein K2X34_01080 [Hyphomonadaceae bacterium]|nr:hypothetical protein [Hyphomonadaceae bacterium]
MQEAEIFELVFIAGATAMTAFTFVVTFTFAYLTVAYFLGPRLTRLEVGVVTGVYLIASFLSFAVVMANVSAMHVFQEELAGSRVYQRISLFMDARIYEAGLPLIYALSVVTCLFFMWNIRRKPSIEQDRGAVE